MSKIVRIIIALIFIAILVAIVILVINSNTLKQKNANLNSVIDREASKNPDGTMGPNDSSKNYATGLSKNKIGSLTFYVTDPSEETTWNTFPTHIPPANQRGEATSQKLSLDSLIIQIKKIEVYLNENGGHWETLNGIYPYSIDLLQLTNNDKIKFSTTSLAEGKYSEIRFYIEKATGKFNDGKIVDVSIKGNNGKVRVLNNFNIETNKNRNLVLDLDGRKSVSIKSNQYILTPFVKKLTAN